MTLPDIPLRRAPVGAVFSPADDAFYHGLNAALSQRTLARMDRLSRLLLRGKKGVSLAEVEAAFDGQKVPTGAWALNFSHYWACTAKVSATSAQTPHLFRTLDWPWPMMGKGVVVYETEGACGRYYSVGWPGFVGVCTAFAPARFAVSFNQAPAALAWLPERLRHVLNIPRIWAHEGYTPMALLKELCEHAQSYDAAKALLEKAPLCVHASFALIGPDAGQHCIIERCGKKGRTHTGTVAVTNHWLDARWGKKACEESSHARLQAAQKSKVLRDDATIVFHKTRFVFEANVAAGSMRIQAYENGQPVSRVFHLNTHVPQ